MNYKNKQKFNTIKAKVLRFLGITKPIHLTPEEVNWIRLSKCHFDNDERFKGKEGIEKIKVMFSEVYGWDPNEYYHDFLDCMFKKLLDLHLKINDDQSGSNMQLHSIFKASFGKNRFFPNDYDLPIERSIMELVQVIFGTTVIKDGVHRFHLNNSK